MTIEDGSSLSQSKTHLEVFENLVESDCTMLRDIVNNQLIPRMVKHGFPIKGLRFEWDDAVDYTPEQQVAYETMVADRYEVDPSYFAEKYSMPVGERRNAQPMLPTEGDDDTENNQQKKHEKLIREYFNRLEKELKKHSPQDIDTDKVLLDTMLQSRRKSFFD